MRRKINILHINNSNVLSQYLLSIGKNHTREKYNLTIGCFAPYGPLNAELTRLGVNTINISIKNPLGYIIKAFAFYRLLKKLEIDILHLHTFYPSFFGVIIGRLAGVKTIVVTRHHANQHVKLNKKLHIKIDAWTAKNCDKLIAVSDFTKEIMVKHEGVPPGKIRVIHNGIDELKYYGKSKEEIYKEFKLPENTLLFLCISRFYKEKNIETAIKAIKQLNDNGIDCTLLVAGAGIENEYHKELRQLALDLKISEKFICAGFRNDIGDLLKTCDALIHPSLEESFGFAVLEAMANGVTIFCSDIPAANEVATKEVAYMFTPGNYAQLIVLITNWYANKTDAVNRINKGLELYKKNFTFITMIKSYEAYYEE